MIEVDVEHVFECAGGPRKLISLMDKYVPGHGLNYPNVQMWKQRRHIAAVWVPTVLYVLLRHGEVPPLSLFTDDAEFDEAG